MRKIVQVAQKNKTLISDIMEMFYVDLVSNNIHNPILELELLGSILYLSKMGTSERAKDCLNSKHDSISGYNFLAPSDSLYDLVCSTLSKSSSIDVEKFRGFLFQLINSSFAEGELLSCFDEYIESYSDSRRLILINHPKIFYTPRCFSVLVETLIGNKDQRILCPFGDIQNLATDLDFKKLESLCNLRENRSIGLLRLGLSGKIERVLPRLSDVSEWVSDKFDSIVSFPPFSTRIRMSDSLDNSDEKAELIALNRFDKTTTEDGICIAFAPLSIMTAKSAMLKFRQSAMDSCFIDVVIHLPQGLLPHTNIPLACIVLRKSPQNRDSIRMVDASSMFSRQENSMLLDVDVFKEACHKDIKGISRSVKYSDIVEEGYSWDVSRYLSIPDAEDIPEDFDSVKLENVVTPPLLNHFSGKRKGKLIRTTELSNDWVHCELDLSSIQDIEAIGSEFLIETAIVVSTVRSLKPTIVQASPKCPVLLGPGVMAFVPKPSIDPHFLCMALSNAKVQVQGASIPHIRRESIKNLMLLIPTQRDQQKLAFEQGRQEALLSKAKEAGLLEVIDRMKTDYINEVRSRKHDMMSHLNQLECATENVSYYLTHKLEMEESSFLEEMKEEVEHQKKAIKSLNALLQIFSRENQFGIPEVINIDRYLMNEIHDGENYISDHDSDYQALSDFGFNIPDEMINPIPVFDENGNIGFADIDRNYVEGINVSIAPDDLQRLCDNIIGNAVKHGFTDPQRRDYHLTTFLTVDSEKGMFQIDFTNNGTPLPQGLDKLRYGLRGEKAGNHAGTGEGGYVVKSIVEHYGGDFDIFSEERGNQTYTTVRILLPIYTVDE